MHRLKTLPLLLALAVCLLYQFPNVSASDPDPLQSLCVADLNSSVSMNGFACKQTAPVNEDFVSRLFTSIKLNSTPDLFIATPLFVAEFPGLNTAGVGLAQGDLGPGAVNVPHIHPRATELLFLLEGRIQAGFISNNQLFTSTLEKGNVFLFPRGLVHYQLNLDNEKPARFLAIYNSQNPGAERLPSTLFSSGISDEVLQKAFKLKNETIAQLRKEFTS